MSRYASDGRLQRSLEAAVMVMESFHAVPQKISFDISGHSGDTDKLALVAHGHAMTRSQRLAAVRKVPCRAVPPCSFSHHMRVGVPH
jgi:hypothetical protein